MNTNSCIGYLEKVINGLSEAPENKMRYYRESLQKIKRRNNDPNLNVAVIGDFSSGKSTFINAFIQRDLLKTAWVATTAIPTYILYHNDPKTRIVVCTEDETTYNLNIDSQRADLERYLGISLSGDEKSIIAALSTTNEFCKKISRIRLHVSSFKDLSKIHIIDTPGVNPGDEKARDHVMQTQNVLREYADATIILFQSTQVLSNSFNTFLDENASHFMDNAIFIITMMDIPDEEERNEMMEYARNGIRTRFGIEDPMLFGCSAIHALPGRADSGNEYWKQNFDSLRHTVIRYMRKNRIRIINQQIKRLLTQLINELNEEIVRSNETINDQIRILERNSISRLKEKMDENYRTSSAKLESVLEYINTGSQYDQMLGDIIRTASNGINSCDTIRGESRNSITGYIKNTLPQVIELDQNSFYKKLQKKLSDANDILKEYCESNRKLFNEFSVTIGAYSENDIADIPELKAEYELRSVNYSDEGLLESLGMITGAIAAAPFAIIDGLFGTGISSTMVNAVDGARNALVNKFGNLQERKKKAITAIEKSIRKNGEEGVQAVSQILSERREQIISSMKNIENDFSASYRIVYSERKKSFNKKKSSMEKKIKSNNIIRDGLNKYLSKLQ